MSTNDCTNPTNVIYKDANNYNSYPVNTNNITISTGTNVWARNVGGTTGYANTTWSYSRTPEFGFLESLSSTLPLKARMEVLINKKLNFFALRCLSPLRVGDEFFEDVVMMFKGLSGDQFHRSVSATLLVSLHVIKFPSTYVASYPDMDDDDGSAKTWNEYPSEHNILITMCIPRYYRDKRFSLKLLSLEYSGSHKNLV